MTEALVCMKVAASAKGCVYDTFRKNWRAYVRAGFPAPVADQAPYRWRPSSLSAWQERQEAATLDAILNPATDPVVAANQNRRETPPTRRARGLERERSAVLSFMSGSSSPRGGSLTKMGA